jgi:endonuclease IV
MDCSNMQIGFSTGSIALGDFNKGIEILRRKGIDCIELSSLRELELQHFISSISNLDLSGFNYISFHAPSKLVQFTEKQIVDLLHVVLDKKWLIVVHPDIIKDYKLWQSFGSYLCIENMDKRKSIGRTAFDLKFIFQQLPDASFCFDVAHARQVDSTMTEAILMIKNFGSRIKQIHLSDLNSQSKHEPLNLEAMMVYRNLLKDISKEIPIILETPVSEEKIDREINRALFIFEKEISEPFLLKHQELNSQFSLLV